jgi:hypothetical protein
MMYRLKCNTIVQGKDEVCDVGVQVDAVCRHEEVYASKDEDEELSKKEG